MITDTAIDLKNTIAQVAKQIGNTPLLPIKGLHKNPEVQIFAKVEWMQLSGSVKARAAFNIISRAVASGQLHHDKILLDATSGNTGIAYATIGKILGIKVTLCLPVNASKERKQLLQDLGAEIIYTSNLGGTDEAQEVAAHLAKTYPDSYFYADQYSNNNNWKAHYYGTAKEIFHTLPDVNYFVSGLGTTGTFTGTSRRLKELNPDIKTIALQPDFALHGLEGWKHLDTVTVPKIYDASIADLTISVSTGRAYEIIKQFYATEKLLISPSSAANIAGAVQLANEIEAGTIVTILPDKADRYTEILNQIL